MSLQETEGGSSRRAWCLPRVGLGTETKALFTLATGKEARDTASEGRECRRPPPQDSLSSREPSLGLRLLNLPKQDFALFSSCKTAWRKVNLLCCGFGKASGVPWSLGDRGDWSAKSSGLGARDRQALIRFQQRGLGHLRSDSASLSSPGNGARGGTGGPSEGQLLCPDTPWVSACSHQPCVRATLLSCTDSRRLGGGPCPRPLQCEWP